MGIETRIEAARGLRTHVVTGPLSLEPLREALERVYAQPDFDPAHHVLWDLRVFRDGDEALRWLEEAGRPE